MTGIASFISTLRTTIPTLSGFSGKSELFNPLDLAACGQQNRLDSWGVTFGQAKAEEWLHDGTIANNHRFSIVLCREVPTTLTTPDEFMTQVAGLKQDAVTLQSALLATSVLGLSDVEIIRYDSQDRVAYGNATANCWITMAVNFNVTIREPI